MINKSWRLRFPAKQEKQFREDHYRRTIWAARASVALALVLNIGFIILDNRLFSSSKEFLLILRYVVLSPVVLICLVLLCLPLLKPFAQLLQGVVALCAGLGTIVVLITSHPDEAGYFTYQAALILSIMATYTFLQLRFGYAALIGWLDVVVYCLLTLLSSNSAQADMGMTFFFSNTFFFVIANILGMFVSYSAEFQLRRNFIQHQIIELEQKKSERLLHNILPREIAATLKNRPGTIANYYASATILFADVVNFTPLAAELSPTALVEMLDEIFSYFDSLAEKYGVEKIKTIGDCYMVAAGVPTPQPDHAKRLAALALEMQAYSQTHSFGNNLKLNLRIGLNSGPVVAGIIGYKKFSYDLWGDTVNTASRIESHGAKGVIQLTRATYELIKDEFSCEAVGIVNLKGKGATEVWQLTGTLSPVAPPATLQENTPTQPPRPKSTVRVLNRQLGYLP